MENWSLGNNTPPKKTRVSSCDDSTPRKEMMSHDDPSEDSTRSTPRKREREVTREKETRSVTKRSRSRNSKRSTSRQRNDSLNLTSSLFCPCRACVELKIPAFLEAELVDDLILDKVVPPEVRKKQKRRPSKPVHCADCVGHLFCSMVPMTSMPRALGLCSAEVTKLCSELHWLDDCIVPTNKELGA